MKKQFSVVVNSTTFPLVEYIAHKNDIQWINNRYPNECIAYEAVKKNKIDFDLAKKQIAVCLDFDPISIDDFLYILTGVKRPMKIGSYDVEFKEDGITVGCQEISKDKVREIATRLGLL